MSVEFRTCTKCGDTLPLDTAHFRRSKSHASGYERRCKSCRRAYGRAFDPIRDRVRSTSPRRIMHRRASGANARAAAAGAVGVLSARDIELTLNAQHGLCADCGADVSPTKYQVDHRTPLSAGGSNTPDNIALVCGRCNMRKGRKSYRAWVSILAARGIYTDAARRYKLPYQPRLL